MTQHDGPAPFQAQPSGLKPAGKGDGDAAAGADGEMRGAALTFVIALYPLVGSVTVVIAALLLAGGALAG